MNRKEMEDRIARRLDTTAARAHELLNAVLAELELAIATDDAVSLRGFGVFEAFTINTYIIGSGWTPDAIVEFGFLGIAPFWERFFIVGFHIAASALAGYGLAKGLGWQFYLIAAGAHSLVNYATILYQRGYLTITQIEIYIAVVAALVTIAALWLRYRKGKQETPPVPPAEPVETPTPSA